MNVHLTAELEKLIEAEVARGHYSSADEVIREGLKLLAEDRQWREIVRQQIAEGMADARAAKLIEADVVRERALRRVDSHRNKRA